MCKKYRGNTIFHAFKRIRFHTHRKDETNTLGYDLLKENATSTMMFCKDTKSMVCSFDGNTDFFDIVTKILLVDIFVPYMFIICLDYILQTLIDQIKEGFLH